MMRMEISFEQRGDTIIATLKRDSPTKATTAEQEAHDRVYDSLFRFCSTNKICLLIPAAEP